MYIKSTATFKTVGTASGFILSANPARVSVAFVNSGAAAVWISKADTAVVGSGILLSVGGSYTDEINFKEGIFTGNYSAIAAAAGNNVGITEDYIEN